ncbi:MAG TPA: kelch repeat-containing protein, partial [Terriglobales bacterium]
MLRAAKYVAVVVAVLAIAVLAKAGLPSIATGTWQSAGQMTVARAGAASVLLPDGRIMIIGGTDANGNPLATTEFFDTNGNFVPGPAMNVARAGHTAIWLANGEVLVTGGTTSAAGVTPPAVTNSAEVFDPLYSQNGWTQLAPMPNARTGHTTTMLQDGSVLIAGGENSGGPVSGLDILEIAPTEHFVSAGAMLTPRRGHAAAALNDGRVLIVGGTDVNGATLASTEIFNPAALSDTALTLVTAGPSLSIPRFSATATLLTDGRVLVAGGGYPEAVTQTNADGSTTQTGPTELASMEVFDPIAGTMTTSALSMSTARSGHQAFLLPNNNNVLIVGGTYNGQALASADLYSSWQNSLVATSAMSNARTGATGSGMNTPVGSYPVSGVDGVLLVAGGSSQQSAELYGFATVKTDKDDYAPGQVVTITGTGWAPYENVTLNFVESPNIDAPGPFTVTADEYGNIIDTEFAPDALDLKVRFYLTAIGASS